MDFEVKRSVVEFVEEYRGLKYVSKFQSLGFRCGYVVIPDDILDRVKADAEPDYECIPIDAHGGITFFGVIFINKDELDCEWVIGFDCGHYGDLQDRESWKEYFPEEYARIEKHLNHPHRREETVKTQEFIREECHKMIDQIIDIYYNDVTNC